MKKLTTTGKVRLALADSLERVTNGSLPANDAKAIVGLANQITNSIAVEIKHIVMKAQMGQKVEELGALKIGE